MVKRERQQAALGVFVCGQLSQRGGLACQPWALPIQPPPEGVVRSTEGGA
jgi:hypothetical protein